VSVSQSVIVSVRQLVNVAVSDFYSQSVRVTVTVGMCVSQSVSQSVQQLVSENVRSVRVTVSSTQSVIV
jgi:hypothetical protein